jgi:transposase InsO family protein
MPGNGYVESFNSKLRDELLNGEVFNSLREAQALIERWRRHDNEARPHSSLGYRPPTLEVLQVGHRPKPGGSGPGGATQVAERVVH